MARRKAVTAVEKDEEVRVTRSTRSRAAQAAQQAPPSIPPPPPPPPPAPRGRTAAKSASRKRKSSVSSDEDDELATKKANIRTSSSPPPTVNRGRKAAIKNARGRHEMDVEEPENVELPPVVEAEHESGKNLPMGEGRENVEVEAEVKKPKKARKAPAKRRGAQKKVAVPDSGIRKGRKPGRKFDGSQIEVEPEMSATDDADDGEASALTSSMLTEDKTDTPPSSFLVQEDSNMATKGVGAQVEEPEKVKRTPARKRGAKKMEVASDPAEPKVEASEETTAANVEKPKAKRGRKPGPKATRKGGRKPPAVKAEAEEEASIEGSNVEVGVQEGSLERVGAEGTTADNNIISGAGLQGEKDGEIGVSEAPADRVSVEETITNANADIEVTKAGEARVEESEADAAATKEVVLEETAVGVAILDESAIREFTVESTAFDKAPEIELPIVEEEAKAEEVGVEGLGLALAETGGVVIGEPVVGETALEHLAVEDAIIDKSIEIEATRAEEAQMVEKIVEDVSVEVVGSRDSNAEKTIAEDTTLEPKAPKSGVFEAVEEEVAIQQLTRPDAGGAVEDLVDDTTAPGGILAESAGDETNATTNIAAEPVADDTIGNIATAQAEGGVPGKVREDEEGQLSTEGSAKDPGKSSPTVVDAVGSDIRAEIEDGCHALPSFKRKARGRLSEPAGGKVADFVKMDASHKRQSTGGGLPLPKRRRVTPPPMQPPSTPAAIAPSPRKVASPSAESTPRSTGTLATPVKPLGPFLMPPATPEAVAGFGRSPTKGSAPLGLVLDDGDDDDGGDDGGDEAMVATTEGARRWGREMAQRHLQQYQGVFEKLRGDFEISEGFQQAYQGVMRRAFTPGKPSPGRARLSPSSSTLLAFEGHGLDDGDDSFDRSFNRAVSPDRSSVVWAWDIEHEGAWNQKAEGGSDGADDEDGAKEAIANPLNVEEKASIAVIMDAPRDSNILEPTEVQEVVMSDRPAELELAQELGEAEKPEEVMTRDNDGEETEEAEEDCEKEGEEESEENSDRGGGLPNGLEGPEIEDENLEGEAGEEIEDSERPMGMEMDEDGAEPDQGMEEPEAPAEAESLMESGGLVGTCNQVKPSRLRIPAAKALKLSKAPRIPVPASRVATVKMRKVSVASLKDVPISKMTPHELASTTNICTARNKLYSCNFTRRVVHKNVPRPPSPNAKVQTLKASQDRARRRAIQEETGVMLGPGDEENFDPNPSAKVRWDHPLESLVDQKERKSPSQAKGLLPRPSILSRSAELSKHGNVLAPPTEIVVERTKVTIDKILYRGEKK